MYEQLLSKIPDMYWDKYPNLIENIQKNPFFLVNDEDLFPFTEVATNIKVATFDTFLLLMRYAIKESLIWTAKAGDTCIKINLLNDRIKWLLRQTKHYLRGSIRPYLRYFEEDFHIDFSKDLIGLKKYYEMEKVVKNFITSRMNEKSTLKTCTSYIAPQFLDKAQKNMIENFNKNNICVLTGGPGTGKSTVIKEVIERIAPNTKIAITAPTGKACIVLKSIVRNLENGIACTTQKLLGFGRVLTKEDIEELRTIECFIIDETSMVDLYNMFLIAMIYKDTPTTFVFVGDVNQLPSVDCGYVLHDLVELGVKTYKLTKNFRSEQTIAHNADSVIKGKTDFIFDDEFELHDISENPLDTDTDILLTPFKSETKQKSSYYLNKEAQRRRFGIMPAGQLFHAGDDIIFSKTNYKRHYINGEIGKIVEINTETIIIRKHDPETDGYILVEVEDLDDIDLAYALTIHKSQGSEYNTCGIVISEYTPFISKQLLYTAITRAKHKVILWSTKEILKKIVTTEYEGRMSFISQKAV